MTIKEIKQKNVEICINSGWNIYEWAEKHPLTTIATSLKRIEKIFDFSDSIQLGYSGGKDSTVSANLACLELNLRKLRVEAGIDRDGNNRIDPLDAKWANKRLTAAMTDAEVCFTSTNDYSKRFLAKYGPEGLNLIEFYWICLPLAWQSGVSFDSGILISWDKEKKDQWVQEMPTREELHGFDCINENNLKTANPVPLFSLSEDAQRYHKEHGNVFKCQIRNLFNPATWYDVDPKSPTAVKITEEIDAVANFGRGPVLQNFKAGTHEKEEQDDFSFWMAQTTWLIS